MVIRLVKHNYCGIGPAQPLTGEHEYDTIGFIVKEFQPIDQPGVHDRPRQVRWVRYTDLDQPDLAETKGPNIAFSAEDWDRFMADARKLYAGTLVEADGE